MSTQGHRISFYATPADLASFLDPVEANRALRYAEAGTYEPTPGPRVFDSFREIELLGHARIGDQNHVPMFLVMNRDTALCPRAIQLRRGGVRVAIDQLANPDTIVLRPGGVFGEHAVIAGGVDTISGSEVSLALFALFRTQVRRHFSRIRSCFVGPEAELLLERGARLTYSVSAPTEYDLAR